MQLTFRPAENRFVALCSFYERHEPKGAGFRWDPQRRQWWTADAARARQLEHHADHHAKVALGIADEEAVAAIEASRAGDSDLGIPCPEGLAYLPYQRAGIAYALNHPRCLIGDEMGLGKTIQAIGLANILWAQPSPRGSVAADKPAWGFRATNTHPRILIVCPASLRINWAREWERWCVADIKPKIALDIWPLRFRGDSGVAVILSYEGLVKWKGEVDAIHWDLVIADEVHYAKSATAKRTKALFGGPVRGDHAAVAPVRAHRILALTGTPIVNRPLELWPIVRALDPEGLGAKQADYKQRYCGTLPEWMRNSSRHAHIVAKQNAAMAELHHRLRARIMVRRLKSEVLTELPRKRRQLILLDPSGFQGVLAAERAALEEKRQELARLKHEGAVEKLRTFRGAAMAELSRIRHETAVAKLPAVIDHLLDTLESEQKVVVFCHHHDMIDGLIKIFGDGKVHQPTRPPIRQVDGFGRVSKEEGDRLDVDLRVPVRNEKISVRSSSTSGSIKGLHEVPPDEAWSGIQPGLPTGSSRAISGEASGDRVYSEVGGSNNSNALPPVGGSSQVCEPKGRSERSVSGSTGPGQGIYSREHVGNKLAGELHQTQRHVMGVDDAHKKPARSSSHSPTVVVVDGRTSQEDRDLAVRLFQTDPNVRVFVGSIRAAGLGITLTAAQVVLFGELDWTPAAMVQAEDRLHRIGQAGSVLAQHLVIDGSIDAKMSKILVDKAEMIDRVLDGKIPETAGRSVIDELLA